MDAFVQAPEHSKTRAAAEALLEYGDSLPEALPAWSRSTSDARLAPWVHASILAPDHQTRSDAVMRIGEWALRSGRFRETAVLIDAGIAPSPALRTRHARLELMSAFYNGQTERAREALEHARALHVAEAELLAPPDRLTSLWPTTEWTGITLSHATHELLPADPSDAGDPVRVAVVGDEVLRLDLRTSVPGVQRRPRTPGVKHFAWLEQEPVALPEGLLARGDLDSDGVDELYGHHEFRDLVRLVPTEHGYERSRLIPGVSDAQSDVMVVDVADVDADGRDELIVGLGAWTAYDLRVYEHTEDGDLTLRARTHRHTSFALTTMPDPWGPGRLIVSYEDDVYTNARVFGADDPSGPPNALLVRRLEGNELVPVFTLPLPQTSMIQNMRSADIDGDGRPELVAGTGFTLNSGHAAGTLVLWSTDDRDTFRVSYLPGRRFLAALQLDNDPAYEVVAVGPELSGPGHPMRELVVLGRRGAPHTPPQVTGRPLALPAPEELLGSGLEDAWQAAALLRKAGLDAQAAEALQRLALIAPSVVAAHASTAAGDLWAEEARPDLATHAYGDAAAAAERAQRGDLAGIAWAAAIRTALEAADPRRAVELAKTWRAAGGTVPDDLADPLGAWERTESTALTLHAAPLHPSWRVEEPLAIEISEGTLVMDWFDTGTTLADLPVTWSGGPIALMVEADLPMVEWGSSAHIRLGPIRARVAGGGGGQVLHTSLECDGPWERRPSSTPPSARPHQMTRVRFHLTWEPSTRRWTCLQSAPDLGIARVHTGAADDAPPPDTMSLTIDSMGQFGPFHLRGHLRRLELWGLTPRIRPPPRATSPTSPSLGATCRRRC